MGHVQLPQGKRIAVNLGTDFDAQSLWLGAFNKPSPSYMSRGEFGAEVGTPRLLELYDRFNVTTNWFTPGHTVDTFPDACRRIRDAGHELALAYVTGGQAGMQDTETIYRRWKDIFDYAYERVENPVYVSCVHPQIIGQAHHMLWYERLIEYIASKDGVWFATCDQIADAWVDDDEDRALMARDDVRGVEPAPADSGWA